jgi:hypothetical protein
MSYTCSVCDDIHSGPPYVWGPQAPDAWNQVTGGQQTDGELGTDQCVLPDGDKARCFVIGRLEIPVVGEQEPFAWLVWVEVQPEALFDMSEKWNQEGRETAAPYDGFLANHLSIYEHETLDLTVRLHTRPVGERPYIEVTGVHQLKHEQRNGISELRVQQIAELLMH